MTLKQVIILIKIIIILRFERILYMNVKKPNILFAIADDASHYSAYGHSFVKTPAFDWVAKNGVLFTNAFTTNPKCAPSRASILTGMHTWQLGEACNHLVCTFPEEIPCYPEILDENGYTVGYTGKGWSPGHWNKTKKYNPAGPLYEGKFLEKPKYTNVSNKDYAANFSDFLDAKDDDEPFCFWYGAHEPHRHYVPGEGMRNGKNLDDIESIPTYWPDNETIRSDILDYAFEIEWFDSHLGRMIRELKKRGELDNTLIVVTSDNGCPFPRVKGQMYEQDFHLPLAICWLGKIEGGRVCNDLISFTDFAPTFLDAADIAGYEMTGMSIKPYLTGENYINRSSVYMGRECHDCGREGDLGYPVRCVRTSEYLYVHNFEPARWPAGNPETLFTNCDGSPTKDNIIELNEHGNSYYYDLAFGKRPEEELYNIISDSECLINLAENPEYQDIKNELWISMQDYLKKTGDPRIMGNGSIFDDYVVQKFALQPSSWQAYLDGRWELPAFMDWRVYIDKE